MSSSRARVRPALVQDRTDSIREAADGIVVRVRLTPRAGRDGIDGTADIGDGQGVLAARVAAAPVDGAANKALEKLVAGAFGVARGKVKVVAGHKGRVKSVQVSGDGPALAAAARALLGGARDG